MGTEKRKTRREMGRGRGEGEEMMAATAAAAAARQWSRHTERTVRPRTSPGKEGPPRSLQKEGQLTNHLRNYHSIIYVKPLNVVICYHSNEKLNESLRHASNTNGEKLKQWFSGFCS